VSEFDAYGECRVEYPAGRRKRVRLPIPAGTFVLKVKVRRSIGIVFQRLAADVQSLPDRTGRLYALLPARRRRVENQVARALALLHPTPAARLTDKCIAYAKAHRPEFTAQTIWEVF